MYKEEELSAVDRKFISQSKESIRMFRSNLLEACSKVHFTVPIIIYLPVIAYFVVKSLQSSSGNVVYVLISFPAGLIVWSLTEYVLHRFVFHFKPTSEWGKKIHFIFHGIHHDFPNDAMRLVMPPSVSIPLAFGFYLLFDLLLPRPFLNGFYAAFIAGYLFYDINHYAIHHFSFQHPFWKKMKHHHMLHHYADADSGYGVSSPLWDKVFKSEFKK